MLPIIQEKDAGRRHSHVRWLTLVEEVCGGPRVALRHGGAWEEARVCEAPEVFLLSQMSDGVKRLAKKRPAAASKTYLHTLAGDNAAEGVFGCSAQSRRRMNLAGRRSGQNAHVNTLAVSYLMRKPGLVGVLEAVAEYRRYAEDHLAPSKTYGHAKDVSWLHKAQ